MVARACHAGVSDVLTDTASAIGAAAFEVNAAQEKVMRAVTRTSLIVFVLAATATTSAQRIPSSLVGTWTMAVAQSTFDPGPGPKSQIMKIELSGSDAVTVTFDVVNADGQAQHRARTTRFDGTDVAVQGGVPGGTQAFSWIDDRTYQIVGKMNGRPRITTRATISADGKTITMVATGTNAQGRPVRNSVVFEKP
jgi:hypothetical protein